jgi:hypothetical protein
MWLITLGFPILVLVIAGLLLGGVYTLVLLPIALVLVLGFGTYAFYKRSSKPSDIPGERERVRPLPHTDHVNTPTAPSTPDQLVDAQRAQQ